MTCVFVPDGRTQTVHREVSLARWTFVIGKDGTIIYKTRCVNAPCAAKQVLEFIEQLTQEESPVDLAFAR